MAKANLSVASAKRVGDTATSSDLEAPRVGERLSEELVFATVGPVGSGCTKTARVIESKLKVEYGYDVKYIRLSDFIRDAGGADGDGINDLQDQGDRLREEFGGKYLAAKAIERIHQGRRSDGYGQTASGDSIPRKLRRAYIIDSIKHPDELRLLRATYGELFWLIGVFAPLRVRQFRLRNHVGIAEDKLHEIVSRDYREKGDLGQQVSEVFHQADFFIRNDGANLKCVENPVERFLDTLFGVGVHTPTSDETAMYAAHAAASSSACLSRQVGAAITDQRGELISVGRNDVPQFGGGLYVSADIADDNRCHNWQTQVCHNDKKKNALFMSVFNALKADRLLADKATEKAVLSAIRSTDAKGLIEYSRAVHAEMDAITTAARLGKSGVLGGTLFSTTYPCHSCARHIVATGLHRVVFIEPYPKSLAGELHSDSVSDNEDDAGKKVVFLQYSGVAPKNILKLFKTTFRRKDDAGKVVAIEKKDAKPVVGVSIDDYPTHESLVIAELAELVGETVDEKGTKQGGQQATFLEPGDSGAEPDDL